MSKVDKPRIAVVDYGVGNLFSVKHACEKVGLDAEITSRKGDVESADAVILPGVGAFGDAMNALCKLSLIDALWKVAESAKPLVGICLGMQLLMTESYEFGRHEGLGIIPGRVVRFDSECSGKVHTKVPQVGWNKLRKITNKLDSWKGSLLKGIEDGVFMYFVHSYYIEVSDPSVAISTTHYGNVDFCSTLQRGNIFACQFHPERSAWNGVRIYENLASTLNDCAR